MSSDYLDYFKLKEDPFRLTPDIFYYYESPEHATALHSLEYCMREKEGFCLLTGEPGTGKTTLLRLLMDKWKTEAEIALIMTPRLSPDEFFQAVLEDFNINVATTNKNDLIKAFRDFLLDHAGSGRRVAIIVDEAQELPDTTLEELRLLSNLETDKEKLLQIILIGQPELRQKLLADPLRQLNQRITVRVELKSLTEPETSDYINTRLIKGGNSSLLIDEKAKVLIYNLSNGIPRTINLLASRSLMAASLDGSRVVFEKHVRTGASDVLENTRAQKPYGYRRMAAIAAGIILAGA
ncbi:MAG: AAA family ATPase, partial [Deltaproteobacteria bacterium]|nr:AAA family ATPase [Deltaproteobacteria bacterium]